MLQFFDAVTQLTPAKYWSVNRIQLLDLCYDNFCGLCSGVAEDGERAHDGNDGRTVTLSKDEDMTVETDAGQVMKLPVVAPALKNLGKLVQYFLL